MPTGNDLRRQVAGTITGWMGATRGSVKHKEILAIYNGYKPLARGYAVQVKDAWCATTVSAVWIKCGIAPYLFTECSCTEMIRLAKQKGIWVEDDAHVPQIGDAPLYDWDDDGKGDNTGAPEHIGLMTAVNGTTSFVVTEGNMGSASKVGTRTMQVNGRYIRGFICPDYDAIAKALAKENETEEDDMVDIDKLIEQMTPKQAWQLAEKANQYAATLKPSDWAAESCKRGIKSGLFTDGDKDGLVDNAQAFVKRQELATVLDRAGMLGE